MKRSVFLLTCWIPVYHCLCVTPKVPCSPELSVDITDSVYDSFTGTRTKNNITFTQYNYFVDNGTIRGCICNVTTCVRKCCPLKEEIGPEKACVSNEDTWRNYSDVIPNNFTYAFVPSFLVCQNKLRFQLYPLEGREGEAFSIDTNGHLQYKTINLDAENFCLAYFSPENISGALICIKQEDNSDPLYYYGMIISMPFLLATFLVYALLPDRNLPAKALMCYVLSLLFAYILLVTIQLDSHLDRTPCVTLAFFCYFFFMASFFWMNASCLDIFFTFSGIRGLLGDKKKENRRFMYYSAYAWGIPILMVGFAAIFTFQEEIDNSNWYTGIGNGQCWFKNGWPTGIYFYFPIATLLIVNIVLFGVTTYKIKKVQHDTKMLKNVDSRKHRKYDNNDKQRFNLYVKLLFAMGINWSMEVISWAIMWKWATVPDYVWVLTDFCNAVYGVFIFFIFVFKRNIWMMLKKRYLQFTGRPQQAHTLTSVNRTTITSSLQSLSKTLERKITPTCLSYNATEVHN